MLAEQGLASAEKHQGEGRMKENHGHEEVRPQVVLGECAHQATRNPRDQAQDADHNALPSPLNARIADAENGEQHAADHHGRIEHPIVGRNVAVAQLGDEVIGHRIGLASDALVAQMREPGADHNHQAAEDAAEGADFTKGYFLHSILG